MKEDTLKELSLANDNLSNGIDRVYGEWHCEVLNAMYKACDSGDKIHIVIDQSAKKRPELAPYTNPESQLVLLNVSPNAVLRFSMNFKGITFECGLRGTVLFDTYSWDEVIALEVHSGGYLKSQIPLDPEVIDHITKTYLGVHGGVVAETVVTSGNVIKAEFGKRKSSS